MDLRGRRDGTPRAISICMTTKEIAVKQTKANVKYEAAKKIRQLLDEAKKEYGADWDDDDIESQIIELVTGE